MTDLTMAADMVDRDLDAALTQLRDLDLTYVDLKQHVFDRAIEDLDDERRVRLAATLDRAGMRVYCFASVLGHRQIDDVGERDFRRSVDSGIANMIETAPLVCPEKVRLLSCKFGQRAGYANATEYLDAHAPWVYAAYQDGIDQLATAGLAMTIENEPNTILSTPDETIAFFERLDRPAARFTWDVQNMWQSGTYPSLAAYETLRPLIDYVHLKGGRSRPEEPGKLAYRSPLDTASWPVREIVQAILDDGVSPVLCVNPSHGAIADGYEFAHLAGTSGLTRAEAIRDVGYLRATFAGIA